MSVTDMVADILKKQGEWMESSRLLIEVMEKRNVSDRQAYRDIEEVLEDGKIRKVKLGGDVLYGLPNWAFPDTSSKRQEEALTLQDAFKYQCFKKLDAAGELSDEGNPRLALNRLSRLINTLPPQQREKLSPARDQAFDILAKTRGVDWYTTQRAKLRRAYPLVEALIKEISTVLHES